MQYVPAMSFPRLTSPSYFIGPSPLPNAPLESRSVTVDQRRTITGAQSTLAVRPLIDLTIPPLTVPGINPTGTTTPSISNSSARYTQQQLLLLPPPTVRGLSVLSPPVSSIAHRNSVQVVETCLTPSILEQGNARGQFDPLPIQQDPEPFIAMQSGPSALRRSSSCSPQSMPLDSSTVNQEAQADCRVTPPIERNDTVQQNASPLLLALHSGALPPLHGLPNLDFDLHNTDPADVILDSENPMDDSSDSDSDLTNMDSDCALNDLPDLDLALDHDDPVDAGLDSDNGTVSNDEHESSQKRLREGRSFGKSRGTQSRPYSPAGAPNSSTPLNGSDLNVNASSKRPSKRRRSASPPFPGRLGSKENVIDVDKVTSLFEPTVIREYV
jgi:hypothetical protein